MPLIDFRAKPNTREFMAVHKRSGTEFYWKRFAYEPPPTVELAGWIDALDANGVDLALLVGRQLVSDGKVVLGLSNDLIAECVNAFPGRLMGFAGVDAGGGEAAAREAERSIRELGLCGISTDPPLRKISPADRSVYPIYEKAAELGVPVYTTVGPLAGRFGDPYLFDDPTADFPTVNFIFCHAVWPETLGFLGLAFRRPNVFLEPSIYWRQPGCAPFFEAANGQLADQIVYGSGFPYAGLDAMRELRERWDWTEEAWTKFTYGNAARLLRLPSQSQP